MAQKKLSRILLPILILAFASSVYFIWILVIKTPTELPATLIAILLAVGQLLFIVIFIRPINEYIRDNEAGFSNSEKLTLDDKLASASNEIINKLSSKSGEAQSVNQAHIYAEIKALESQIKLLNKTPEIEAIYYSYNDVNWRMLLEDAVKVEYSLLYAGENWIRKYSDVFTTYIVNGGELNLYVPNPYLLSNFFYKGGKIKKDYIQKIISTIDVFNKIKARTSGNLTIHLTDEGFNYPLSYIKKRNGQILYMMGVYQNNYAATDSPVVVFNSASSNPDLRKFFETEKEFLEVAVTKFPDLEENKYIVWNENSSKVFISTGLACPGQCKFCYIDSLVEERLKLNPEDLAGIICNLIVHDKRFKSGKDGTTIMLGGFTDPFVSKHFKASMFILNFFSQHNNYIHIATRYTTDKRHEFFLSPNQNVVINFSISSLRKDRTEVPNQLERFKNAKMLIQEGYKVALFIRPIIQGVTINDLDEIIAHAKNANIKVITIGGLYIDERIQHELTKVDINVATDNTLDKKFVLDDKKILKKLQITDVEEVLNRLRNTASFIVFENSEDRINYYSSL